MLIGRRSQPNVVFFQCRGKRCRDRQRVRGREAISYFTELQDRLAISHVRLVHQKGSTLLDNPNMILSIGKRKERIVVRKCYRTALKRSRRRVLRGLYGEKALGGRGVGIIVVRIDILQASEDQVLNKIGLRTIPKVDGGEAIGQAE